MFLALPSLAAWKVPSTAVGRRVLTARRLANNDLCRRTGEPRMDKRTTDIEVLKKLAIVGATVGPLVDAVHNKALLRYEFLDFSIGPISTSLLVPVLLAVAYPLLGGVLPSIFEETIGTGRLKGAPDFPPLPRAGAAVASTFGIVKISEIVKTAPIIGQGGALGNGFPPLQVFVLAVLCLIQWLVLDASYASLVEGFVVAFLGPLCELPFQAIGAWNYMAPPRSFQPFADVDWARISFVTLPCYFAVTTDAIQLGKLFASELPAVEAEEAEEEVEEFDEVAPAATLSKKELKAAARKADRDAYLAAQEAERKAKEEAAKQKALQAEEWTDTIKRKYKEANLPEISLPKVDLPLPNALDVSKLDLSKMEISVPNPMKGGSMNPAKAISQVEVKVPDKADINELDEENEETPKARRLPGSVDPEKYNQGKQKRTWVVAKGETLDAAEKRRKEQQDQLMKPSRIRYSVKPNKKKQEQGKKRKKR